MNESEGGYTVIVVPSDAEGTRSVRLTPGVLRVAAAFTGAATLVLAVLLGSWWYFAIQAGRVPGLERQVARLEADNARVGEFARALEKLQGEYEKIQRMLGADVLAAAPEPGVIEPQETGGRPAGSLLTGLSPEIPTTWPLATSGFVTQVHGGSSGTADGRHPGLDIAVAQDSYILASGAGVVQEAGSDSIYGLYVLIEHGDSGYSSMYGHASRLFVSSGDAVRQSEVIALSGNTGRSTAPHLHFEIHQDGRAVDPLTLAQQQR